MRPAARRFGGAGDHEGYIGPSSGRPPPAGPAHAARGPNIAAALRRGRSAYRTSEDCSAATQESWPGRSVMLQALRRRVDCIAMSSLHATMLERRRSAAQRCGFTLRGYRLTRARRVLWLLAAVWVLNGFDLGFTMVAHVAGHFTELNPIAADLLRQPWYYVTIFKFVSLGAGTVILLILARHKVAELGSWLLLAAYVFVAARWYHYFERMLEDPLLVLLR